MLEDVTYCAEKFSITNDDKFKVFVLNGKQLVKNGRLTFFYGLVFNSFANRSSDKQVLRDDVQKALLTLKQTFKLKDSDVLKVVVDTCTKALKCKYTSA